MDYEFFYSIDEIRHNQYMGEEYITIKKDKSKCIFLFENVLQQIAPNLTLRIGSIVRITKDDKNFIKRIELT